MQNQVPTTYDYVNMPLNVMPDPGKDQPTKPAPDRGTAPAKTPAPAPAKKK